MAAAHEVDVPAIELSSTFLLLVLLTISYFIIFLLVRLNGRRGILVRAAGLVRNFAFLILVSLRSRIQRTIICYV